MKSVIKKPHISEKSTKLMQEENGYVFVVDKKANKIEISKAVEELYDVDVKKVTVISIPAKKRRLGRTQGEKKGYKKAIVKIKEGQNIEIFSA
jgi:large subunit ribosomal protein L23